VSFVAPGRSKSAILEQCSQVVTEFLRSHSLALAEPVGARFLDAASGSTGVEISVRLRDRGRADAARDLLRARFGSPGVDVIHVR
jgi:hypothetical protein